MRFSTAADAIASVVTLLLIAAATAPVIKFLLHRKPAPAADEDTR